MTPSDSALDFFPVVLLLPSPTTPGTALISARPPCSRPLSSPVPLPRRCPSAVTRRLSRRRMRSTVSSSSALDPLGLQLRLSCSRRSNRRSAHSKPETLRSWIPPCFITVCLTLLHPLERVLMLVTPPRSARMDSRVRTTRSNSLDLASDDVRPQWIRSRRNAVHESSNRVHHPSRRSILPSSRHRVLTDNEQSHDLRRFHHLVRALSLLPILI